MNNRSAQGEFDDKMLSDLIKDIDYKNAGLTDLDISILDVSIEAPMFNEKWDSNLEDDGMKEIEAHRRAEKEGNVKRDKNFYEDDKENQIVRHAEVKKIKDRISSTKDENSDRGMLSYVVLSFLNPKNKQSFMQKFGFHPYEKHIDGEEFGQIIEVIE